MNLPLNHNILVLYIADDGKYSWTCSIPRLAF